MPLFKMLAEECCQGDTGICTFNLLSCCSRGRKCSFLHDTEPHNVESTREYPPCYFFMKGKCTDGESCQRSHTELPCFNGTIKKVCHYFSRGRCDRGKQCGYIHDLPPGDIYADSKSDRFRPENNHVSPVIINPSDDVQSRVVKPKLCRFYPRGMCFFGDRCTNLHDNPEKDSNSFISNLRENEALNERNKLEKISPVKNEIHSNVLPVAFTENKKTDIKIESMSTNQKYHSRKSRRVANCSSKSKELLRFSYNSSKTNESRILSKGFTNVDELTEPSYTPIKSVEQINLSSSSTKLIMQTKPCNSSNSTKTANQRSYSKLIEPTSSCSSLKPKELTKFANNSSNSKKFVRAQTYSPSYSKIFSEESKSKESEYGRHISSKSKELAKYEYSSKSMEFIRGSCYTNSIECITSSCIPLKPKGSSNYTCSYLKSKEVSNFSTSKNNFGAQCKSKLKKTSNSRCTENFISEELSADDCLESKEFTRNKLKEQLINKNNSEPVNSLKHSKITDELRITKESFSNTVSDVTSSCNLKLRNFPMTRKQSKSQRKPKSENMQSCIFFKKMFFQTPVTVKRVTKKL